MWLILLEIALLILRPPKSVHFLHIFLLIELRRAMQLIIISHNKTIAYILYLCKNFTLIQFLIVFWERFYFWHFLCSDQLHSPLQKSLQPGELKLRTDYKANVAKNYVQTKLYYYPNYITSVC